MQGVLLPYAKCINWGFCSVGVRLPRACEGNLG